MHISPIHPTSDYANYSCLAKSIKYGAGELNGEFVPVVEGRWYPSEASKNRCMALVMARRRALKIVASNLQIGVRSRVEFTMKGIN